MHYLTISSGCSRAPEVSMFKLSTGCFIKTTPKNSDYPDITFFLDTPQDVTNFKNNVLQAYEKFMKGIKDA